MKLLLPRRKLIIGAPTIIAATALGIRRARAVTVFSGTINSQDTDNSNRSNRCDTGQVLTPCLGQVRVTLATGAGAASHCTIDNSSIGIAVSPGTNPNTTAAFGTATFIQLKYSGANPCVVPAAGSITSDWVGTAFTCLSTDHLIVVMDISNTGSPNNPGYANPGPTGSRWWRDNGSPATYNVQTPSPTFIDVGAGGNFAILVSSVETQSAGGGGAGGGQGLTVFGVGQ
jgi:hypothetical protein